MDEPERAPMSNVTTITSLMGPLSYLPCVNCGDKPTSSLDRDRLGRRPPLEQSLPPVVKSISVECRLAFKIVYTFKFGKNVPSDYPQFASSA